MATRVKAKSQRKVKKVTKRAVKKKAKAVKKVVKRAAKSAQKKIVRAKSASKSKPKLTLVPSPAVALQGGPAPTFEVASTGNRTVSLSSLNGKKVVLYFYPKDNTPGCTQEGKDFSELSDQFYGTNTVVLGVSKDSVKSHEGFKTKMCFPFELLSDEDGSLCKAFGVMKLKQNYGREYIGIERSTFVIDENGVVRREWRGVRVNGHAQEVLEYVKSL